MILGLKGLYTKMNETRHADLGSRLSAAESDDERYDVEQRDPEVVSSKCKARVPRYIRHAVNNGATMKQ